MLICFTSLLNVRTYFKYQNSQQQAKKIYTAAPHQYNSNGALSFSSGVCASANVRATARIRRQLPAQMKLPTLLRPLI